MENIKTLHVDVLRLDFSGSPIWTDKDYGLKFDEEPAPFSVSVTGPYISYKVVYRTAQVVEVFAGTDEGRSAALALAETLNKIWQKER